MPETCPKPGCEGRLIVGPRYRVVACPLAPRNYVALLNQAMVYAPGAEGTCPLMEGLTSG